MTQQDQGLTEAPDGALFDDSQSSEQTAPPAAQQPVVPPELINAVTGAVAGELRTLHGQLRRDQQEFQRLMQQPRTADNTTALDGLASRVEELASMNEALTEALIPDEQQRAAFRQQRELLTLRRQVSQAKQAPPPAPDPTPAPLPAQPEPDLRTQVAMANAQAAVASFAEGLDINLQALSEADRAILVQGVPTDDLDGMVRGLKTNLRKLAQQRTQAAPPSEDDQRAQTRQQVRNTNTAPAARGPSGSKPPDLATAEMWLATGRCSVQQFRAWGYS